MADLREYFASTESAVLDEARAGIQRQKKIAWATIVTTGLAVVALVYGGYQITIAATGIISDARYSIDHYQKQSIQLHELEGTIRQLEKEILVLKRNNNTAELPAVLPNQGKIHAINAEEVKEGKENKNVIKKE